MDKQIDILIDSKSKKEKERAEMAKQINELIIGSDSRIPSRGRSQSRLLWTLNEGMEE